MPLRLTRFPSLFLYTRLATCENLLRVGNTHRAASVLAVTQQAFASINTDVQTVLRIEIIDLLDIAIMLTWLDAPPAAQECIDAIRALLNRNRLTNSMVQRRLTDRTGDAHTLGSLSALCWDVRLKIVALVTV